jgi:hypothetical protein
VDTKSQDRNKRFELDTCWYGFCMNVSDDGPSTYVSLYENGRKECSAHTAHDEMVQKMNRRQEGGKGERKKRLT